MPSEPPWPEFTGENQKPLPRPGPEAIPEALPAGEPLLEAEGILEALPVSPWPPTVEVARPRSRRKPERPHPGFLAAVGWCLLMILVTQVFPGIAVAFLLILAKLLQAPTLSEGLKRLQSPQWYEQFQKEFLLPGLVVAHLSLVLFSLVVLRLVVGRNWRRQIALHLPNPIYVLLALIGTPALWILCNALSLLASKFLPPMEEILCYLATMVLVGIIVGLYWLALRLTTGKDWTQELARSPLANQLVLGPFVVFLVLVVGGYIFWLLSPHILRISIFENMGDLLAEFQEWPLLVGILVIGGLPCLSEELWCRAYLGRGLVGRQGLVLGVILTSILFGVIHGHPHQGAMAAVMGICLHYAYLTSRSLMIPMLIHFLNNSLAVTSHRWAKFFGDKLAKAEMDPETIPPQIFAAAFLLVMAVAWALYASRARLVQKEGSDKPLWQPSYPGVALPPPGSNTYVASSWPGWLPSLTVLLGIAILGISLYLN